MKKMKYAMYFALFVGGVIACQEEVPANPPEPTAVLGEMSERDLEAVNIEVDTRLRELDLEIERIEGEWDPSSNEAVTDLHRENVRNVRARMNKLQGQLDAIEPHEDAEFARARKRAEFLLEKYDERVDVLEAAIARAGAADAQEETELPGTL